MSSHPASERKPRSISPVSARARVLFLAAVLAAGRAAAQPITITNADLFNQVGQYYQAYCNSTNDAPTAGADFILGTASTNAQFWDFSASTLPTDITYRFDYIPASQGTDGTDFVALGATVAQRQTNLSNTNDVEFLYFKVDPTKGQLDWGFYDPTFSGLQPESTFTNALQDFPNNITYGSTWSGSTQFTSQYDASSLGVGVIPEILVYTSTDIVDAFGYVNLPTLGLLQCLRVHELVEYDIWWDLTSLGVGMYQAGTEYALNYYWLAPGHGVVVQINSPDASSPPSDDLSGGVSELVRMFAAYHPVTNASPANVYIQNLKITLQPAEAFLSWTALTGSPTYTVQYTTNLASSTNWQTLTTTASNFALDPAAVVKTNPQRFYRVLAPVGSK